MKNRPRIVKVALVALALVTANLGLAAASLAQDTTPGQGPVPVPIDGAEPVPVAPRGQAQDLYVVRVKVSGPGDIARLTSGDWDVLEARGPDYLLVMADAATVADLQQKGFTVEVDQVIPAASLPDQQVGTLTYYGGYRSVAEHYARLDTVAATYPSLARVFDYGDSWRKVNNVPNGHDLKAICITANAPGNCALSPSGSKPRFLLMAAIHARELTTAEVAYRWIDELVTKYNVDADVTWLLDHHEMWVIPVANPDGRLIVEGGGNSPYTQRKNANTSQGACANPPTTSSQYGVDLNRNASTDNYGGAGTSTSPCSLTYRGPGPASEPEEIYLEQLFPQLFADTKPALRTSPAAANTTGAFISLHSYSNLVLLPYGDATTGGYAPNDAALRSLAFRMSNYNGYQTGTGDEILYPTTGTTDDWIYGKLGVPGFTFEIGPSSGTCSGFTPAYSCVDSTFWPANRPALLYAAKIVREPYALPFGPTTGTPTLSASTVSPGAVVTLNATVNDNAYGNAAGSVGRPAAQNIAAAEVYIDTPPWAGGTPIVMGAQDGAFNASSENVSASINTTGLSLGRHILFVRGRDASNNWGPVSAVFLTISNSAPVVRQPVADAYVRGGTNANTNFGSAAALAVRFSTNSSNIRNTYLKFDISSLASVSNARIRLYGNNTASGAITVQAFGAANTTWAENTITYNTAPASSTTVLASQAPSSTAAAWYEFDITSYVQSERAAGRTVITIVLKSPVSTNNIFNANSKEAASNRPELVVTP